MGWYQLRRVPTGFRFHLKASNGQTVAVSQTYASPAACKKGMESLRRCADAPVWESGEPTAHPRYEIYRDRAGQYRFRLTARNGKTVASSEGYTTRSACLEGIAHVRENASSPEISEQ